MKFKIITNRQQRVQSQRDIFHKTEKSHSSYTFLTLLCWRPSQGYRTQYHPRLQHCMSLTVEIGFLMDFSTFFQIITLEASNSQKYGRNITGVLSAAKIDKISTD